jgi:hypothetical protein
MAGAIIAIGQREGAADEAVATTAAPISAAHVVAVAVAEIAAMNADSMTVAHMPAASKTPMAGIASTAALERRA